MKIKDWGMMLNDNLGDCTCAAPGHMIQQWTYYAGHEVVPPDSTILKAYEAVGGYNPNDPGTDNGANMLDVLNYWRKTGIDGHKILAYVSVDPKNLTEVKQAVELFGNVYLGIQLPVSAQNERAWTVPSGGIYSAQGQPGSWGGHAIPVMAYSSKTLTCITWGARLKMSWNFFEDYTDELYAVLSQDWVAKSGVAPSKLNLAQLQTDLAAL
jgi:hypothetical protein